MRVQKVRMRKWTYLRCDTRHKHVIITNVIHFRSRAHAARVDSDAVMSIAINMIVSFHTFSRGQLFKSLQWTETSREFIKGREIREALGARSARWFARLAGN